MAKLMIKWGKVCTRGDMRRSLRWANAGSLPSGKVW
ncbi:hypothetical protein OOU_Y34scaffold00464g50 [Pyricularia oryzae Y34]|uniref:Uncharacterized protein n=2 Tax=Pyricularia oryzae TaxID=318829 RepID=A0AA97PML5_PYRO3|nr:hypothetical protein OOU_Y34scaffold00464g50 [Pyricularia oryzae Y34]